MDNYKIVKTEDAKWAVLTRDYFWQKWHPYTNPEGKPVVRDTIDEALRSIGSVWWVEFKIRVNAIGTF